MSRGGGGGGYYNQTANVTLLNILLRHAQEADDIANISIILLFVK